MEAPQRMLFYTLTKDKTMYDIEIVDDNYTLPVDYKRFSIGYAKPYNDCVDDPSKCPLLPMPHQLKHYVDENRNGKEVMIAKLYGPYYGSTNLMLYFYTFRIGGGLIYEKSFHVDSEKVFQYLENLKLENQKIKNLAKKEKTMETNNFYNNGSFNDKAMGLIKNGAYLAKKRMIIKTN